MGTDSPKYKSNAPSTTELPWELPSVSALKPVHVVQKFASTLPCPVRQNWLAEQLINRRLSRANSGHTERKGAFEKQSLRQGDGQPFQAASLQRSSAPAPIALPTQSPGIATRSDSCTSSPSYPQPGRSIDTWMIVAHRYQASGCACAQFSSFPMFHYQTPRLTHHDVSTECQDTPEHLNF